TLLSTGWDILTAAHCVADAQGNIDVIGVNAGFLDAGGGVTSIDASGIYVKPGYGATGTAIDPNDLAIIRLSREADPWMTRYNLYQGSALFETALFAGYGLTGNGMTGAYYSTLFNEFYFGTPPVRRAGFNSWEST